VPSNRTVPRTGCLQAEQVTQQGALAGTRAAHDHADLARHDAKIDAMQDAALAVVGLQAGDVDQGLIGRHCRRSCTSIEEEREQHVGNHQRGDRTAPPRAWSPAPRLPRHRARRIRWLTPIRVISTANTTLFDRPSHRSRGSSKVCRVCD
jgi:hypothetical protein